MLDHDPLGEFGNPRLRIQSLRSVGIWITWPEIDSFFLGLKDGK